MCSSSEPYDYSWSKYTGALGQKTFDSKSVCRVQVDFVLYDQKLVGRSFKHDIVLAELGLCEASSIDQGPLMGDLEGAWIFQLVFIASTKKFVYRACSAGQIVDTTEANVEDLQMNWLDDWYIDMPNKEMRLVSAHPIAACCKLKISNVVCTNDLYPVFGVFNRGVYIALQCIDWNKQL